MKRTINLRAGGGFTLIEILIVIAIITVLATFGIGAYSRAKQKISLDVAADNLVAALQTFRSAARSGVECTGIRFIKEKKPQKLTAPFKNPREGCAAQEIKTALFPFVNDVAIAKIVADKKEIDTFDLLFEPPHGALGTNPSGDLFEVIVRSKTGGPQENTARTVVINTETGRIEKQ